LLSPKEYGQVYVGRHDYRNGGRQDGVELFNVQNHFRHPDYIGQLCCGYNDGMRFNGVSHDFMLLKLDGMSTKTVVSLETNSTSPVDDQELYLMGFGDINANPNIYVEPDRLFEVTLNYLSNEECASSSIYPLRLLPSETLCATDQRQDGCQGKRPDLRNGLKHLDTG
jgi:Trypsin